MASLLVAGSKPTRRRLQGLSLRPCHESRPGPSPRSAHLKVRKEKEEEKKEEEIRLLTWAETEEWQQLGSDHIQTGYRKASPSVRGCVCSWLYVHNETVNIYSHILGATIFLLLPSYVFAMSIPQRYRIASATDVLVCSTYFLGVAVCFSLSTAFHTLMAHSRAVYLLGLKIDLQGVLVLMWSATIPLVHYTFPCDGGIRTAYGLLFTVLAGACSAVTFLPQFSGPHLGPYRAALFGSFGAGSFAFPIAHGLLRHGMEEMRRRAGLGWILATVVCNGLGVWAYAMKFPERWFPRRFDLFGASHQLMHICVVLASLTYACAVVQAFDYRHELGAVCCS